MIKALVHSALFPLLIALAGASYAQGPQIEHDALEALVLVRQVLELMAT